MQKAAQTGDDEYLGRTLDARYRLDAVIGAGAIGRVYAGTQLAVDRKVAIKLLHPSAPGRQVGTERFLREAKAVARLSDASCLTLFDFGFDEALNCFYMVTEFVDGITLAEQIVAGPLRDEQIYYVLFQVATALAHAHECGILHRDLKPENIMLVRAPQGEAGSFDSVKVLDFGLARLREEAGSSEESTATGAPPLAAESTPQPFRLTHFGELNGTPAYMSPEQCRGDLDLTPACDYYALGVLAYELFEGHLPFRAEGVAKLLTMHLDAPIPALSAGRVPTEVEEMIYRLLGKKPQYRLQSSEEVLQTLRAQMTLERAQDVSLSSLDRFRLSTPESEVAIAGAETLLNYDPLDTPLPVEAPPQAPDAPGRRRAMALGILVALVGGGVLGWWASDATSEGAHQAQQAQIEPDGDLQGAAQDAPANVAPGGLHEDSPPKSGNEDATSLGLLEPDAGGLSDASGEPQAGAKPTPAASSPATKRPRKLDLTY